MKKTLLTLAALLVTLLFTQVALADTLTMPDPMDMGYEMTFSKNKDSQYAYSRDYKVSKKENVRDVVLAYIEKLMQYEELSYVQCTTNPDGWIYHVFDAAEGFSYELYCHSDDKWRTVNCCASILYHPERQWIQFCFSTDFTLPFGESAPTVTPTTKPAATATTKTTTKATAKPTATPRTTSSSGRSCSTCGGDGEISRSCTTCGGDGEIERRCTNCGGDGKRDCISCSGKGKDDCSGCNGSGERRCGRCYGTGEDWKDDRCNSCGGDGEVKCSSCSGSGYKRCSACSGSGDRKCTSCSGSGETESRCSSCSGDGRRESSCTTCGGDGRIN